MASGPLKNPLRSPRADLRADTGATKPRRSTTTAVVSRLGPNLAARTRSAVRQRIASPCSPPAAASLDGLLLAGGKSRRFGSDKRLALLGGQELVRRAASTLLQVAPGTLFVAGGADAWRLPLVAAAVRIADQPPGCGPLGGIAAALERSRRGIVVLACDLPCLRVATLAAVARSGLAEGRAAALWGMHGWEPLISYWPREALLDVRSAIDQRMLAPQRLLERLGAVPIRAGWTAELANVNRPEDLHALQR